MINTVSFDATSLHIAIAFYTAFKVLLTVSNFSNFGSNYSGQLYVSTVWLITRPDFTPLPSPTFFFSFSYKQFHKLYQLNYIKF